MSKKKKRHTRIFIYRKRQTDVYQVMCKNLLTPVTKNNQFNFNSLPFCWLSLLPVFFGGSYHLNPFHHPGFLSERYKKLTFKKYIHEWAKKKWFWEMIFGHLLPPKIISQGRGDKKNQQIQGEIPRRPLYDQGTLKSSKIRCLKSSRRFLSPKNPNKNEHGTWKMPPTRENKTLFKGLVRNNDG